MSRFLTFFLAALPAFAAQAATFEGVKAYGDWQHDAPGVTRHLTASDLPSPYATSSATNGPTIVPRPNGAELHLPSGFTVTPLLSQLKEPRQLRFAPNGDLFFSESGANAVRLLPASRAKTGTASVIFADHLPYRPYGLAFYPSGSEPRYLYVATEGAVLRFRFHLGQTRADGAPETVIAGLPTGDHWTRDIVFTPDDKHLLLSVGSGSNIAEQGMEGEIRRADILSYTPEGAFEEIFASGLRNPVTLAFQPGRSVLWTGVNERDGMGDNLPPDYITSVTPHGFYGWPWCYTGNHADARVKYPPKGACARTLVPDTLLQPHSAPLGLAFHTGTQFPKPYQGALFAALHGSWNRSKRTGYKIVFMPLENGRPAKRYTDFLTGFVTPEGNVWGRPVGLIFAPDGALLMSDDAGGIIWRIEYKTR